jgi:hypothetical protein
LFTATRSRALFSATLGGWIFLAAGCVHPLGPGYHFADRQTEIRVSSNSPGHIHLHVVDELSNNGDRPMHSLEVRLPETPSFGEKNMRVLIESTEVSPVRSSRVDPRMMSEPFNPAWMQNEKRKIVTEWELTPEGLPRGTIAASTDGFFIADETALPLWQTPNGVFAVGGTKPAQELLAVFAPPDFRVLAPGKPLKITREGDQVAQRYLINPGIDFVTYVVAGRYLEQVIHSRQGDVQFWTFRRFDDPAVKTMADRLSSSMKTFTEFFGPASIGKTATRVVESPVQLPAEFGVSDVAGGASFPQGVLLDSQAYQQGIASEAVLQLSEYELARTWFGWLVRPRPEAQILMGRSVGLFGLVVAAEGRGQDQRRRMILSLIDRFDETRATAPDKRLMEPPAGYSRAERMSAGYRGALFFVALEDLCGHDNLRAALRDIIRTRASSNTGYEELRSALETASQKDLADMFRAWLIQSGIPADFRARYQKSSNAQTWNQ